MNSNPSRLSSCSLREAVGELSLRDPDLGTIVEKFGLPPLWARRPGFAALVRIILEQQVSLISAKAAYRRLQSAAGRVTPASVLALGQRRLRAAGLTRQKAAYCHALATEIAGGRLDLTGLSTLSDDAVRSTLSALPGIGPWTVDIYLIMALRRPDIWPTGDLALTKAVQAIKGWPQPPVVEELARVAGAWAPYRAVAARILWHFYLSRTRTAGGPSVVTEKGHAGIGRAGIGIIPR